MIAEALAVLGLKELKEKQKEAVMTFVQGHDTFVALPTGYGKSIIYAILPLVFDKIKGTRGNTLAFSLLLVFNNNLEILCFLYKRLTQSYVLFIAYLSSHPKIEVDLNVQHRPTSYFMPISSHRLYWKHCGGDQSPYFYHDGSDC